MSTQSSGRFADLPGVPSEVVSALRAALQREPAARERAVADVVHRYAEHAAAICAHVARLRGSEAPPVREESSDGGFADLPRKIGPYRILSSLGSGGMGEVYLAERKDIKQRVALKVIAAASRDHKEVLARFAVEREALARMEHSNIAKVMDAGVTETGRSFFVMEYIKGTRITDYCDANKLSIEARLELFRQVCSGVQHAHSKGVIHRDIKPGNLLVTTQDGPPVVKIIDFGIARATGAQGLTEMALTQGILGTPEYMSPEQAGLGNLDIDTRTDVYSLGVLLYELLTGSRPFSGAAAIAVAIRDADAPRPSTKITSASAEADEIAKRRGTDRPRLLSRLRRDLDWIVLKCLEKDRTRRYDTPAQLADDVLRHLQHEPVVARPPTIGYRLRKLARKYRGQLVAGGALLVTLVVALVVTTWLVVRLNEQTIIAQNNEKEAKRQAEAAERSAKALSDRDHEARLLAGVVYLSRSNETEKTLYPALPESVDPMRRWLQGVDQLMNMEPEIREEIRSLRQNALPPTARDLEADKTTHSRYKDWRKLSNKLAALERARAVRLGARLSLPEPTESDLAMTAAQLNTIAWPLVCPEEDKRTYGEEARALSLARLAWEKAQENSAALQTEVADTLAWALFANGQHEEALAQSEKALALAPPQMLSGIRRYQLLLQDSVRQQRGPQGDRALADLRSEVEELTAKVTERRTFRFDDTSRDFVHNVLSELPEKLGRLDVKRKDVEARLGWAQQIVSLTNAHPRARVTWQQARQAIRQADGVVGSRLYKDIALNLTPQVGLVPIGMNPVTLLWEFYELRSAWDPASGVEPKDLEIPSHDPATGAIEMTAQTGIVFVLLPGGTFVMGAQSKDPRAPNHDPMAKLDERPRTVTLRPFLLARHEMTQGQWARLTGEKPSKYLAGQIAAGQAISLSNPVEQVTWDDCVLWLPRCNLVLPMEAQWEYSARAGTTTPWTCTPDDLQFYANLADATAASVSAPNSMFEAWSDGYVIHAPVGSFRANPFGLHDCHGNLHEWVRGDGRPARDDDGRHPMSSVSWEPILRGGGYMDEARDTRSATRARPVPEIQRSWLGVRAARVLGQ